VPNFRGSDDAANRVRQLDEWKNAKVVFANPDAAQRKVRENVLKEGKLLEQLDGWLNGTYPFSSSGSSWLLVWRINRPQSSFSGAYFLIFKTGQNSSLWISRTDLAILKPNPTANF
jgi:hypothetical protein